MFIFIDCIAVTTCPVLSAPDNGQISCSPGNDSPGDTCTFTCDDGFQLEGTMSRTCQDDGTWDGEDDTVCLGKCQIVKLIQHCTYRVQFCNIY